MRASALSAVSVLALVLVGCPAPTDGPDPADTAVDEDTAEPVVDTATDADGDGVSPNDGDCRDDDAAVYPGRAEDCNGADDNCNGAVDEGLPDADGDLIADCQDLETCDGLDNDGDALVDESFGDADGDGVADCVGSEVCDGLDNNADGVVDEGFDLDHDGYTRCGSATVAPDCDDEDPSIFPDAGEVRGDEIDNDCNGLVDEGDWAEGDLLITELLNNPADVVDPDGEWFEVLNTSGRPLVLNGLVLASTRDGDHHQVSASTLLWLEPGERFVFGGNANRVTNGDVVIDYAYTGLVLQNESDDLRILAGDVVLDTVAWDDGLTMPDATGASMSLDPTVLSAADNDDPAAWCVATAQWSGEPHGDRGSPGEANEGCPGFDHDGDGFLVSDGDCDDAEASVYPGAFEAADGWDTDCDGVVESAPTALADYDPSSSLVVGAALWLDGSASFDAEGDAMSYAWSLGSAPAGSSRTTADLASPTDMSPVFYPDVAGDYAFELRVSDAGATSLPATLTVTITP